MKLLAVTLRYPPYVAGGYELLTRDAVEALRARGHAVTVLCARGERLRGAAGVAAALEPALDGEDPWERALVAPTLERARLHLFRPRNYAATAAVLRRERPDAALVFNLGLASLAPLLALRHAGVPSLAYLADAWPANHWIAGWRADERAARAKAGRLALLERFWRALRELVELGPLCAASAYLRARLVESGIDGETIEVLPAGLPPDLAAAAARAPSAARPRAAGAPLSLVCASSLWAGKGQDVLVEAVARARARGADVRLALAGGGRADFRAALERRVQALGLGDSVRFLGQLEREALGVELARAHALALPSTWGEPYGLVTLEGMAHGLTVVASDAGASPELVQDGVDGLVVRAGDPQAWAEALHGLWADDARRVALGARARAGVAARFGHERFVAGLEQRLERTRRRSAP